MRKPDWLKPKNYRKLGNRLRDQRRWAESAAAYRIHLDRKPEDSSIWVQYGNSLKEDGQYEAAEVAYRRAAEAMPDDSDVHFQIGHVLKMQERDAEAMAAYQTAMRLGRTDGLEIEMRNVKARLEHTARPLPAGMTIYSVQDMLWYLNAHSTFSGIQRVQAGIANYLLDHSGPEVGFVLTDAVGRLEQGDFWLLQREDLRAVIAFASGRDVDHDELRVLLSRCEVNAEPVRAGAGHTIIVLGAFWGLGNTPEKFLPAKRAGARVGVYVYDIIPLSHPEYCETELSFYFSVAMGQMCAFADFILTISDYTRFTLADLLKDLGAREIPMATVPLAHDMTGAALVAEPRPEALDVLEGRDFVAYVSTVEGRKNHLYVVRVWQALIEAGISVPDLVFVGRKGWKVGPLNALLAETDHLDGRVHILHDLTDAELTGIYQNSLFTTFTSFVEGWGLPVGESLLNGTPCVASNVSSMPEVGGPFVDYVDPTDIRDGVRVIGRMIADRPYLDARRREIAEQFQPRGWNAVGADFAGKVAQFSQTPPVPIQPSHLVQGRIVRLDDQSGATELSDLIRNPRGLLLADDFYGQEAFGCWMRGTKGGVVFQTDLPPGTPVVVYLNLIKAPGGEGAGLQVDIGGVVTETSLHLLADIGQKAQMQRLKGRVDASGLCRVVITIDGEPPSRGPGDPRSFMIGLAAVGYAEADDVQARMDLLESLLLDH